MKVIWKYEVPLAMTFTHAMPAGFAVLSLQMQNYHPVFWALVDPDAPKFPRRFRVQLTGEPFDADAWRYIGTFQVGDGALVYHFFEER